MIGLDDVVRVSVLLGLGLLASVALRRRSAATRHWILASTFLAALLIPALARVVPEWRLPAIALPSEIARPDPEVTVDFTVTGVAGPQASPDGDQAGTPPAGARSGRTAFWLAVVWLGGVAAMAAVLGAGFARLWWLARRAQVLNDGRWHAAAATLTRAYGMRPVTLLQSDHPTLLVTWGVARAKVILPAAARGWSTRRIGLVLRHELAHVRRGDWVSQLVAEAVKTLHWYNPLVWAACRRLRTESELACDAELMHEGLSGPEYASELLDLARALNAPRASWTAALAMARPSSLEGRVTAMLTERMNREPLERKNRALALAGALLVATVLAGLNVMAQAFSTLSGSVVDQHGGIIPRGTLTLASQDAERKYQIRADDSGQYQFVGVVPGTYILSAQIPGFKDGSTRLTIAGQTVRRDLSLPVGTLQETITVVHRAGAAPSAASRAVVRDEQAPAWKTAVCENTVPSGRILQPLKIKDVRPRYPENLGATNTGGVVLLDALIGPDGAVQEAKATEASVNPDLAAAAIEAVRQWRFTPTLLNCVPVEVEMTVRVNFKAE